MAVVTSVLLLAGTSEATRLAEVLTGGGIDVVSSLAGVTASPARRPGRIRRGGFGGIAGLVAYLRENRFDAIIDATHPFAAVMAHHVAGAAQITGTASCRVLRPAWEPGPGDQWMEVADLPAAADAVGALDSPRVLLTVGRRGTRAFAAVGGWFLVRAIEAPEVLPPDHLLVLDRGPFEVESERALLGDHAIDVVVTKNAGGSATEAKLTAARQVGVPVVLVARPPQPAVTMVADVDHAVAWLDGVVGASSPASPYQRGV